MDAVAHRFRRRKSEQALRGRIPAGDRTVQRFRDDGVVGRFDGGAEEALASGMVISRGFGAAMFLDLAFQRGGLCIHVAHHARKRPRQHAGLAAGIDGNGDWLAAAGAFNSRRQLNNRSRQRPRNQQSQCSGAQHRDQADEQGGILDGRQQGSDECVREGFDHRCPFIVGQNGWGQRGAARPSGSIRHNAREPLHGSERRCQVGEVGQPTRRLARLRPEFARGVGMNKIFAAFIDDIYLSTGPHRRPDAIKRRPHVDVDDDDTERLAI